MTKKEAYKIILDKIIGDNIDNLIPKKDLFKEIILQIRILSAKIKGTWKKITYTPKHKFDYAFTIIEDDTKEFEHYWMFRIDFVGWARTGGIGEAAAGPTSHVIMKKSKNIYLASDLWNDYIPTINDYLKKGIPEAFWKIKPSY